jgi:hypothetical protein
MLNVLVCFHPIWKGLSQKHELRYNPISSLSQGNVMMPITFVAWHKQTTSEIDRNCSKKNQNDSSQYKITKYHQPFSSSVELFLVSL